MTAHQGRLSVDLWEADLEEGLAQIHQQAGIAISVSLGPEHTVSVQLTDVALDQGRHRLLQLASQSCAMLYAPGPTGEVTLQEVQVFAEAPAGDQSSAGAAHAGEEPEAKISQRFVDTLLQRQAAAPAVARDDESDAMSRFRDALERSAEPVPWPSAEPESEAVRRFQEALEGATSGKAREDRGGARPRCRTGRVRGGVRHSRSPSVSGGSNRRYQRLRSTGDYPARPGTYQRMGNVARCRPRN
jgi:hypothetical protein